MSLHESSRKKSIGIGQQRMFEPFVKSKCTKKQKYFL